MAYVMKRQFEKTPGLGRSDQDWELMVYFKKGTIPSDPKLLKLYPDYIERHEQLISRSRKSMPIMIIVGSVGLLMGFGGSIILGFCGIFILGMTIFSVFNMRKTIQKLTELRKQLEVSSKRKSKG